MTRTVLFSAVKNEAPFLLEWIAYHKAIGFGRIVIFSNDSEDGTTELLEALAKAGEIEHFPHQVPEGASPQGNAARIANEAGLIGKGDWVLWLDADEFLAINTGNGLLENLIAALEDKIALLIPWRVFGDGGNERFPGRFVSPDFASCSRRKFPGNFEAKTLFRMGREFAGLAQSGIHRPLVARGARIDPERIVTASGSGLDLAEPVNSKWLAGEDFPKSRLVSKSEHGYRMAQINHYCVRTPEHFVLKRMRGRGWAVAQAGEANIRHTAGFYRKMNRNDVEDRLILRFEDQTIQAAEDLRNHPEVARAEARARELVAAQVARVSAAEIAELAAPPPKGKAKPKQPAAAAGGATAARDLAVAKRLDRWVDKAVREFQADARGLAARRCPLCGYEGRFAPFGRPPRLDARCGGCGSLERHRLFALHCEARGAVGAEHRVLHFAPEPELSRFVRTRAGVYETADLSQKLGVTHVLNIEATGLPDAGYDRIVCNHVLEHVDDRCALAEIFRLLKPGGLAFLSTPVIEGWTRTYENPEARTPAQRKVHFGQYDHVRFYGADLRDRIRAAGFVLEEYTAEEPDVLRYGLVRGEKLFLATRPGPATGPRRT